MPRYDYVALGRRAIVQLLDQEHAAVWPEIEAKIGERVWLGNPVPVDPNHLTTARQELIRAGTITQPAAMTRGGRKVRVLHLTDVRRRKTAIAKAARRKRLLHARYLSWTQSSVRYPHGRIGPAGELVAHASLTRAAGYGYRLLRPQGGEVTSVLGHPVPGGALDSAAFLTPIDPTTGAPRGAILLPIEVKNRRHTLYPLHAEVYQLLYKAARIQADHPQQPILPILVCRRRHYNLRQMGVELGFYVIEIGSQPVLSSGVDVRLFDEVRLELGYSDLTLDTGLNERLVETFQTAVPRDAAETWPRWRDIGQHLADHYRILRSSDLRPPARRSAMEALRGDARALGCRELWCQSGAA